MLIYVTHTWSQSTQNCDGTYATNNVAMVVAQDPNSCNFSITGTAYYTSNAYPCDPNNLVCYFVGTCAGYCYQWSLYLNNNKIAGTYCSNNNSYTFSNLSSTGAYKINVIYERTLYCNNCAVYVDQGFVTISNNVCGIITQSHLSNQPAIIKRNGTIDIDCALQNDKTTILLSETEVDILPGANSGIGPGTYFHAYIDNCSSMATRIMPGGGEGSVIQNNDSSSVAINNLLGINTTPLTGLGFESDFSADHYIFNIMPNPNNGNFKLTIGARDELPSKILIQDILNQDIKVISNPTYFEYDISLNEYSNGIYFIKMIWNGRTFTKKIIKN